MPQAKGIAGMPTSLIEGMTGGTKAMWLRQHRGLVLEYREVFGDESTKHTFCLKDETLDALVRYPPTAIRKEKEINATGTMDQNARALLISQIAQESARATKARVNELEARYEEFVQLVADALMHKFLVPLLQGMIQLPPGFEKKTEEEILSLAGKNKE